MKFQKFNSSLRQRSLLATLSLARDQCERYHITRITNSTYLDVIGIPVYTSVRPDALNLCVNAGKGLTNLEAQIGAIMECYEYSLAEERYSHLEVFKDSHSLLNNQFKNLDIHDFGIRSDAVINYEDNYFSKCTDLLSNKSCYLPSELLFHPLTKKDYPKLFGTSTNGLASGNNLKEASLHGIFEIIERDIISLNRVLNNSVNIKLDSLPETFGKYIDNIYSSDLALVIQYIPNNFKVHCFECFIIQNNWGFPTISGGSGAHTVLDIALTRAFTEAAQSRVSHIHGGRDDFNTRLNGYEDFYSKKRLQAIDDLSAKLLNNEAISLDDIENEIVNVNETYDAVLANLDREGFSNILVAEHTCKESELTVAKVVIPKMEHFEVKNKKIGKRLLKAVQLK